MERIPLAKGEYLREDTNGNILVVGATGSGKTTSVSEPRLLYSEESSLVIPIVKRRLLDYYGPVLKERGYRIVHLDLSTPANSTHSINLLEGVETDMDVLSFASEIVGTENSRSFTGESDPYWGEATVSTIAAEVGLVVRNARYAGKAPDFLDVIKLHGSLGVNFKESHVSTLVDSYFDECEANYPGASAPKLWRTFSGNASRTSSCIYSMVNNALDKLTGEDLAVLFNNKSKFCLSSIGEEKTALFITSSPVNVNSKKLSNLLYSSIFRCLFKKAEEYDGKLPVPVHIIADDFACQSKIPSFSKYISVFREIGISCTLLLQSLSQLVSSYGVAEARTIEDNCDTRIFLGTNDVFTAEDEAKRLDVPVSDIFSIKRGGLVLAIRGEKAKVCDRYNTYSDSLYISYFCNDNLSYTNEEDVVYEKF